jgi:hypothetical protein
MIDYWQILPHLFLLKRLVFKIFVGFSGATILGMGERQRINIRSSFEEDIFPSLTQQAL